VFACDEFSNNDGIARRLSLPGISANRPQVVHGSIGPALDIAAVVGFSANGRDFDPLLKPGFEFGPDRCDIPFDIRFHGQLAEGEEARWICSTNCDSGMLPTNST